MDLVDTLPDVRYWSKILPVPPNLHTDLKFKVTDLEFFMVNVYVTSVSYQKAFIFQI